MDQVVRKIDPFGNCVRVGQTGIFQEDNKHGPPAILVPTSFKEIGAQAAAKGVALPWQAAIYDKPRLYGKGSVDTCPTKVDRPLYTSGFAFVSYSDSGGAIGAIAFRRKGNAWQISERVRLGYW